MISRFSDAARVFTGVWLISGATALAQQSSVEVRSPSAKLLDTAPGRIVTASVVVANRGARADEFIEHFSLPRGCQKVAPPDLPFRLEPGGQIVRVLAVLVPATMPAGRFDLRYMAQSRRDPSSSDSVDLEIQVTTVDKLDLVVEKRPDLVLAGDAYPVKLWVTNRGNSEVAVQLTHRSSLGLEVSADAAAFALAAGATREVTCRVQTDKDLARRTSHAVTFDVTATSPSGKALIASQASVADIVPLVSGATDPFHQFPMRLRFIGIAETGRESRFQTELTGDGSLDEAGKHRVDFIFRGPDIQNTSLFGERDEYGVSYHGEHWDIDLGDRVYSLSPLTQKRSLGRGAGMKWHREKTTVGGFYMSTRYRLYNTEELGAFYRQDFSERFSLQGNFLRKTGGDPLHAHALPQNIVTLQTRHRVSKLLDLQLEAGVSRSDSGRTDYAYRAEARGKLPGKLSYAIEHAHAGPDFFGYYSDTKTTYASLNRPLTDKLRVSASFNRYAGNLALNDVRSSVVNRESSWQAGANYSLTKKTELSFEWQHTQRADILAPALYDFTEDVARLGIGHKFEKLHVQGYVDLGTLDNSLAGESRTLKRYNASVSWRPTANQRYSVFGRYGPTNFSGSPDNSLNVGVSAHWEVRDNLTVDLSYARNQYDGLIGREQDQALASLRYQFDDKRSLSIAGRWSRATSSASDDAPNEVAVLVSYSIPFSRPVSRKRSIGVLRGQLVDTTRGGESAVARVVLQVGDKFAVTDEAGRFEFPSLKPGPCELRVLQDSLGPNRAMATPLPMKVKIRPGKTTDVKLTATPACSMSVCVTRFEFADGNSVTTSGAIREAGGQGAVTVEITNGRDVWRAQTDRLGCATFDRLPAGKWNFRVASSDLPALHKIEDSRRTLKLEPGENQKVAVRVLPQRRTLRVLDRGTIR